MEPTALTLIAQPVVVVAAAHGSERSCATTSVMYVSLAPERVAIALRPESRTAGLIERSGVFSVSLLGASQQDVAIAAARSARHTDKLAALGIATVDAPAEGLSPLGVADSVAVLWCVLRERVRSGEQVVYVGEVAAQRTSGRDDPPLVRFRRRYAALGEAISAESPEGYPI